MMRSNSAVVEVRNLTRAYAGKRALDDFSIRIEAGQVYGLVGENGAGKTTLIHHLMGLLKPDSGEVNVFGFDPVESPQQVMSRIGFVSEDRDLPDWLRISEFLRFSRSFHTDWDDAYQAELMDSFELRPNAKIKSLSRGERARVCLVNALSHRPAILLLDEPSSGLDPIVRQDVLSAIIKTVAEEGRTVIFSSHLLDEIQRVADRVCMIDRGKKVIDEDIDVLFDSYQRYHLDFAEEIPSLSGVDGVMPICGSGRQWQVVSNLDRNELAQRISYREGEIIDSGFASLEEIYVALSRSNHSGIVADSNGAASYGTSKTLRLSEKNSPPMNGGEGG